jgi:hypothetical protein
VNNGRDPMLGAILPPAGVLLGVFATTGTTYFQRRRDERHELRAAARLLLADLTSTADYLLDIIEAGKWGWLPEDRAASVNVDAWRQHRV